MTKYFAVTLQTTSKSLSVFLKLSNCRALVEDIQVHNQASKGTILSWPSQKDADAWVLSDKVF